MIYLLTAISYRARIPFDDLIALDPRIVATYIQVMEDEARMQKEK